MKRHRCLSAVCCLQCVIWVHCIEADVFILQYAWNSLIIFTFCVSCRWRDMYIGYTHVSVCLSLTACPHCCMDPDVTLGIGRGCPVVVHYWVDLQSVRGFHCYDNIARTRNVSKCLYSLYAWLIFSCIFAMWDVAKCVLWLTIHHWPAEMMKTCLRSDVWQVGTVVTASHHD